MRLVHAMRGNPGSAGPIPRGPAKTLGPRVADRPFDSLVWIARVAPLGADFESRSRGVGHVEDRRVGVDVDRADHATLDLAAPADRGE